MKKLIFLFAAIVAFGMAACGDKTEANAEGADTADTIIEEVAVSSIGAPGLVDDSTFIGIIGEGTSMHNLVLISSSDDGQDTTTFIMGEGVDKTNLHDIIEGSPCQVVFTGSLTDKPRITYIETPLTYKNAIGKWTCDDPDNAGKKMSFELLPMGKVELTNWRKARILSWSLYNDDTKEITLVVAKNDGEEEEVNATILEGDKTLTIENDPGVYVKE